MLEQPELVVTIEDMGTGSTVMINNNVQNMVNIARRRVLKQSSNLPAAPANDVHPSDQFELVSVNSGSFSAIKNPSKTILPSYSLSPSFTQISVSHKQQSGSDFSGKLYVFLIPSVVLFLVLLIALIYFCRNREVVIIVPRKTGLTGPLQKAFVTGVPKLNRAELEAACEDFSNILTRLPSCIVYKGTLSNGVEVTVASTLITSPEKWSRHAEEAFRAKIDKLSYINHKNFVNLLGYCEEEEPFMRMMVLEYGCSGNLCQILHGKDHCEHLDWFVRMRIIMGVCYCLKYMHHDVPNQVAVVSCLTSYDIFLTEDNAAKVTSSRFWTDIAARAEIPDDDNPDNYDLKPEPSPEDNIYSFGLLMLEIISGRPSYDKQQEKPLLSMVESEGYLEDKPKLCTIVDRTLKSFKKEELEVVCEVILECIKSDPKERPNMMDTTAKLRAVIPITPELATPKLSPLWWAELEVSMEPI